MLRYQLAIYIHPEVHNSRAAERCLDAIRALDPPPARILVVDHAHGRAGFPRTAVKDLDAQRPADRAAYKALANASGGGSASGGGGGLHPPAFPPRAALHEIADEVRTGHDYFYMDEDADRPQRWRRSLRFKRYAIETALEHDLDAVMFLRFPDRLPSEAPRAMLHLLESDSSITWCYLPIEAADREGTPTGHYQPMRGRTDSLDPDGKITEQGFMLRLTDFDPTVLEQITAPGLAEPIIIMTELLQHGHGQGIRAANGRPLHYVAVAPPPTHAAVLRSLPEPARERILAHMRADAATASPVRSPDPPT
ncbi:MAG: hypothetical protein JJU36_08025 [Phycisphaeraceae bacterium]|nr:hypothetical protein [Phycisphaeraceae bacterium]